MKLEQISPAPDDQAPEIITEAPTTGKVEGEADTSITFWGIDPNSSDHVMMSRAAARMQKTNPHLYQKLVNLD